MPLIQTWAKWLWFRSRPDHPAVLRSLTPCAAGGVCETNVQEHSRGTRGPRVA
jgi:hypothetical protein